MAPVREIRHIDMRPDAPRVETGPVQFGEDWPGTFIRGDHAAHYACILSEIVEALPEQEWLMKSVLKGLVSDLKASSIIEE
jgi:hypothetical protein